MRHITMVQRLGGAEYQVIHHARKAHWQLASAMKVQNEIAQTWIDSLRRDPDEAVLRPAPTH